MNYDILNQDKAKNEGIELANSHLDILKEALRNQEKYPVVHIYAQRAHHMEAIILGNRGGLWKLFFAIGEALQDKNEFGSVEVFCNDGEGYNIKIKAVKDEAIDKLPIPYTADYAKDKNGISPSSFLK